jgi:beta-galactosidase
MLIALLAAAVLHSGAQDWVWIEGENPTSSNVKAQVAGWGHKELLSGDEWLQVSIDADKVAERLPAEGGLLTYSFQLEGSGPAEIWDRIGYEFVRSPFDWRADDGPWKRVSPNELTTDMEEFETWNEVAWLQLGTESLSPGAHMLTIRLPKTVDEHGKPERVLYASDALLITRGHFLPNGKHKPDEDYKTDMDKEAGAKVFAVSDEPGPARQTVSLAGPWEICRDDEQIPGPVDQPIAKLPESPLWYGISVPSDKNQARPELTMAHRVWYRTRIDVPPQQAGRSFRITFPQNSLNTTVYVNGRQCGFNKNPFVNWSCDITPAIHAGVNEVWVGIRDAWYGFSTNPKDPMKLRRNFVLPIAFSHNGFVDLAYPVWNSFESGILDTPRLTVAGPIAATDVFVKPSLARKELEAEVTLLNTTGGELNGTLTTEAVDEATGQSAKRIDESEFRLSAGEERTLDVRGAWQDPVLWWPDRPHMYLLRTTVSVAGKPADVCDTPFGFREWSHSGKDVLLNGIVWHGWAELTGGETKEEWLRNYRNSGQRFMRLAGPSMNGGVKWKGMSYEQTLDWFDRNGVVVRRCGPLDGEAIGYYAVENDPDLQALYHTHIKKQLLDNWRDQMVAQVKGERNHPSIGFWSVENEWLYINCINLYADLMDEFEREEKATFDAVLAVDPTRLPMADGGGSGKGNLFPMHGDHYVYTNDPAQYPDTAYGPFVDGGGRGRWTWDMKRPRFLGEEFYATGINPVDYAWIQGEDAFSGKSASQRGMALVQRMLTEGYRWGGYYTAWHFWIGDEGSQFGKYTPNAERVALCRQQDWSFASGAVVRRTLGVFNDSRFGDPIELRYSVSVGGRQIVDRRKTLAVEPGTNVKFEVDIPMPKVASRQSGAMGLELFVGGHSVFTDRKPFALLPAPVSVGTATVGVCDPKGKLTEMLAALNVHAVRLAGLEPLPANLKTVIVAPSALTEAESTSSSLAAFASDGHRVVVLDQANPLHYQGLPVPISATKDGGDFAFPEMSDSSNFRGLDAADFRGWSSGVYHDAYVKPERGAKSLLQAGPRLAETAIVEVPVGSGLMLLSQVRMEPGNAVARQLLANLIAYADSYKQHFRSTVVCAGGDPELSEALNRIGLQARTVSSPVEAIAKPSDGIAVISATPEHLHELAEKLPQVRAFTAAGGTVLFHGLTPAGLADYNRIVGVLHLIRPFRMEKVALRSPRDPLAVGLSQSDIVMNSAQHMFDFNADMFAASDEFSYVVDYDDVAPFAQLPNDYLYNTVNGFVTDDSWKYICSFDLSHEKPEYAMTFPRTETFKEIDWIGNAIYHKVQRFSLTFDGKETVAFDVKPDNSPQALAINPPRQAQRVELKILDWTKENASAEVVGIDNIWLKVARSEEFTKTVHPLLNVGGLVRYTQGKGGFVLANLLLKSHEEVPENAGKKLAIFKTLLTNLDAPFAAGKTVVAGAVGLEYVPIDLSKQANQYRGDRGWFGDKSTTFDSLPKGRHVFANVPFDVFDFPTSPVPNCVMLGGAGVPNNLADSIAGIPVGRKLSSLFFLQAARIDARRSGDDQRQGRKFEMAKYVVHYADGQTLDVPVYSELDVDDYRQENPRALPGAQVGWIYAYPGSNLKGVAYVQQWNNPRPEVEIQSVDLAYGPDRRGVPALLAITGVK